MATITKDYKTIIQKMQEVAPNYIAKYVEWYLTDPEDRCTWEELCTCDQQFKSRSGGYKTENLQGKLADSERILREQSDIYEAHENLQHNADLPEDVGQGIAGRC